ncbi:MAG: VanW family protein [Patescibacteria group bacterium]
MITNCLKNHTLFIRVIVISGFITLAILVVLTGYIFSEIKKYEGMLYPQIFIDGQDAGGKTKKQIMRMFQAREANLKKGSISILYGKEYISTYSAQMLELKTNLDDIYDRAFFVGRTSHTPSRMYQILASFLKFDTFRFFSSVQYNKNNVFDEISRYEDSYNRPAKDALFKFENNRVTSFQKEESGNKILTDVFINDIEQAVKSFKYKPQNYIVLLQKKPVEPKIKLGKTNSFGIEELLGEGVSNYSHSINPRIHNLTLATSKFNGVLIPKNEIFSFNKTVGDISARTGYQPAYIIKEGRTVLGDGGGVCQVSTTLFRAALNTGLPIIEQHAHAYRVSYYENGSKPGLDATVFAPSIDLKIKNDTDTPILIQTYIDEENMLLYFRLYGKKDGRTIEMTTPVLTGVVPPPNPLYQDDPTLKRGFIKQIDFPAWGGKTAFSYKVTKANEILFEKTFVSRYKPWQAVFLVGTQD